MISRKIIFAIIHQAATSIGNFTIAAWLLASSSKQEFGTYNIAFSAITIASGLICSSLTLQASIQASKHTKAERTASLNEVSRLISTISIIGALFATTLTTLIANNKGEALAIATLSSLTVFLISQRDLATRQLFFEENEGKVAATSTIAFLISITLIIATEALAEKSTASAAIAIYTASCFIAFLIARRLFPLATCPLAPKRFFRIFRETWKNAKWGILSNLTYSARSQAHTIFLIPFGTQAVADVNAARLLYTPILQTIPVLSQLLTPFLLRKQNHGTSDTLPFIIKAASLLGILTISYATLMAILDTYNFLSFILGHAYQNLSHLIIAWGLVSLALIVRNCLTIELQARQLYRKIAICNAAAAIVLILVISLLTRTLGSESVLYAVFVAELAMIALLAKFAIASNQR